MEDLVQLIVNNGLGIASFFALMYFIFNFVSKTNETNQKICNTLVSIEKTLSELTTRIERIESNSKQEKF